MTIINLADRREPKPEPTKFTHNIKGDLLPKDAPQPDCNKHLSGPASCALCDAKFEATIPVDAPSTFQCVECQHDYAHHTGAVYPHEVWVHHCGGSLFRITRAGVMCIMCGGIATGWF